MWLFLLCLCLLSASNLDIILNKVDKGPHIYWLEKGIVESRPDHILNLIHYEVRISTHLIHYVN